MNQMQRPNRIRIVLAGLMLVEYTLACAALAQSPIEHVEPAPELRRLSGSVGVWQTTAKIRITPDSPVFEGKSIEQVYWSASGQFRISDQLGLTRGGWVSKIQITTWDPIKKQFQMIDLTPGGSSYLMTMTIEGKVSRVTGSRTSSGHTTKIWLTTEEVSKTESKFKSECSVDDGPRWIFSEGVSTKRRSDN